jgi:hypothetical protein
MFCARMPTRAKHALRVRLEFERERSCMQANSRMAQKVWHMAVRTPQTLNRSKTSVVHHAHGTEGSATHARNTRCMCASASEIENCTRGATTAYTEYMPGHSPEHCIHRLQKGPPHHTAKRALWISVTHIACSSGTPATGFMAMSAMVTPRLRRAERQQLRLSSRPCMTRSTGQHFST